MALKRADHFHQARDGLTEQDSFPFGTRSPPPHLYSRAVWAQTRGAFGTSFWIDPKEELVGILMSQSPSTRVHTRMLFKNLVYGAMVK
jgi:CubicO group peptidase (beta-lactamase class C family)